MELEKIVVIVAFILVVVGFLIETRKARRDG